LIDLMNRIYPILFVFFIPLIAFNQVNSTYSLKVLGVVQDGGLPHLGSNKLCCENIEQKRYVTSIMLINNENKESYLFDASPDINEQLNFMGDGIKKNLKGIFLTHAHIGHYTGLMYFGREALGAHKVPVYVMPKMKQFLESNSPWNQLIDLDNVQLREIFKNKKITISKNLIIVPFTVPHRDEFSETVGYKIIGPNKSALFIPDINKWSLWDKDIVAEVKDVDYAFLDATFFKDGEVNRPMDEIPHPFIVETINLFKNESIQVKNKIHFIHFNHTNISLQYKNPVIDSIRKLGYNFARFGDQLSL